MPLPRDLLESRAHGRVLTGQGVVFSFYRSTPIFLGSSCHDWKGGNSECGSPEPVTKSVPSSGSGCPKSPLLRTVPISDPDPICWLIGAHAVPSVPKEPMTIRLFQARCFAARSAPPRSLSAPRLHTRGSQSLALTQNSARTEAGSKARATTVKSSKSNTSDRKYGGGFQATRLPRPQDRKANNRARKWETNHIHRWGRTDGGGARRANGSVGDPHGPPAMVDAGPGPNGSHSILMREPRAAAARAAADTSKVGRGVLKPLRTR